MEFIVGLFFGIFLTVSIGVLFWRHQRSNPNFFYSRRSISTAISSLMQLIPGATIVIGPSNEVLHAGSIAKAWGICDNKTITNTQLLELIVRQKENETFSEGVVQSELVEISQSMVGLTDNADSDDANELLGNPASGLGVGKIGTTSGLGRYYSVHISPFGDEYLFIFAQDVTAVHKAEQQRRDFTDSVSHEIKTPIGAIAILSETLSDSADDPEAVAYFAPKLRKESKRLSNLVNDVITLSKLDDVAVSRQFRRFDLRTVITDTIESCGDLAASANMELRTLCWVEGNIRQLSEVENVLVWGSRAEIGTALRNLVENAIRYSESVEPISIIIEVSRYLAEITVSDRGIGLSPADQNRVFERFYRVDSARSRQKGGTGLGISIVKHIVTQHGGRVSVKSTPGEGASFTITLPVVKAREVG